MNKDLYTLYLFNYSFYLQQPEKSDQTVVSTKDIDHESLRALAFFDAEKGNPPRTYSDLSKKYAEMKSGSQA